MRVQKRNLMLRFDAKLIDDFDRYCKNLNISKSVFIEDMIRSVLDNSKILFKEDHNVTFNDMYQLLATATQRLIDFERERLELDKLKGGIDNNE